MQTLRISKPFYKAVFILLAFFLLAPVSLAAPKKKFIVVIDAGHGGNDAGAIENNVNEKDVNLAVALKLGNLIKKKLKDTEVIYTRDKDEFISLQKRADIANKAHADLFVSIHCNSVDRTNTNRANVLGATTYILGHHKDNENLAVEKRENSVVELDASDEARFAKFDPTKDESHIIFEMSQKKNFQNSARFAADVQKQMEAIGRRNRGVQQAGFWVLWSTAMPAALIELDFLCNPQQAQFLSSNEGQDKLADAIFNAVKNYEKYFRQNLGAENKAKQNDKPASNLMAAQPEKAREASPVPEEPAPAESTSPSRRHRAASNPAPRDNTATQEPENNNTEIASETPAPAKGAQRRSTRRKSRHQGKVEEAVIPFVEESKAKTDLAAEAEKERQKKALASASESVKKSETAQSSGRRDKGKKTKGINKGVRKVYKILLFTSDKELKANDEAFHGLTGISSFKENKLYNYTFGESVDRQPLDEALENLIEFFPEARVIQRYL